MCQMLVIRSIRQNHAFNYYPCYARTYLAFCILITHLCKEEQCYNILSLYIYNIDCFKSEIKEICIRKYKLITVLIMILIPHR